MGKKNKQKIYEESKRSHNLIAEDYARTRAYPGKDLSKLSEYVQEGNKVLDLGCGNGYLFEPFKQRNIEYTGVDISPKLISIAKRRYQKQGYKNEPVFKTADALDLPFSDESFDKVYSISMLHNIPFRKNRERCLREAKRVLKYKGIIIIRVWNLWKIRKFLGSILGYSFLRVFKPWSLEFKDVFIPWKNSEGKPLAQRYFHCFSRKELKKTVENTGFRVLESWQQGTSPKSNIYLVARKK